MRIANRLLAFIVAAALVVAGVILIIEVVAARAGAAPVLIGWHSILRWGQRNTWNATSVEFACAISAVAGLILLLPQLRRRRPSRLALAGADSTDAAITRKGLVVSVRGAVGDVEGISSSRVTVGHRRIKIKATSSAATTSAADAVTSPVKEAAQGVIDQLHLKGHRRLKVSVANRKNGGH